MLAYLNNSRFFTGCAVIIMNIGGKHIAKDIPRGADKIFEHWIVRSFLIFCIAFVSTRDVETSLKLSIIFFVIFKIILNEKSNWCIIPKNNINIDTDGDGNITMDEIIRAQRIVDRYKKKL